ncbi:MAG: alpha/beta fold hydrolase [Alphaproteobacteria bacterium]|nr:alpha/beta fold hydrolase [Alphaproteobacteria bacterium]
MIVPITADDFRYAPIKPFKHGFLAEQDGHKIYYEQVGNPEGEPILFFHGGPGGGCTEKHRRLFDPAFFNAVLFDQRGCGRSKPNVYDDPKNGFKHNNPQKLLEDAERLREHLGIEKWHVTGGSWGATLALLYAKYYPARVKSLTISGIYLGRKSDNDWYINNMKRFYPEAEAGFVKSFKVKGDRLTALYRTIIKGTKKQRVKTAMALGEFEGQCVALAWDKPDKKKKPTKDDIKHSMVIGSLETYYMKNHVMSENWYKDAKAKAAFKKIKDIAILNGRHDVITPPICAFELHQAHPSSTLTINDYGAHSNSDIENMARLMNALNRLKYKTRKK